MVVKTDKGSSVTEAMSFSRAPLKRFNDDTGKCKTVVTSNVNEQC